MGHIRGQPLREAAYRAAEAYFSVCGVLYSTACVEGQCVRETGWSVKTQTANETFLLLFTQPCTNVGVTEPRGIPKLGTYHEIGYYY